MTEHEVRQAVLAFIRQYRLPVTGIVSVSRADGTTAPLLPFFRPGVWHVALRRLEPDYEISSKPYVFLHVEDATGAISVQFDEPFWEKR